MTRSLRFAVVVACAVGLCAAGATAADKPREFLGWQGLRVVSQEGMPERMTAADVDGDGRQELLVVNTRQSRLDIYSWQPADERKPPYPTDPERPNELPLAADWVHYELPLDDLPADAAAADLDGDGRNELLVLTGPTLKLAVYRRTAGTWERDRHWDLPTASLAGRGRLLQVRDGAGKRREALVSCEQGIMVVPLDETGRAGWFRPRENASRLDWRLADLDGDGDDDLLEWTAKPQQSIRWYENVAGTLRAPQTLYDQSLQQLTVTRGGPASSAEVHCLTSGQSGLVRRYRPALGEPSLWGRRSALPLGSGPGAPWCGVLLGKQPALAAVDPAEPRIRVFRLVDDEWGEEVGYPSLSNVRAVAAPAAMPGTLLLWVKDAGDLFETHWDENRLTYPKIWHESDAADRKILALETVGDTVWSAQRRGADIELSVWSRKNREPERTVFAGVGEKAERVLWLGGRRLLVQQAYASAAKLASVDDKKKTTIVDPPHLAKVNLAEYGLYEAGGKLLLGRLTDGVLQWLDESLQPIDQVMLADGRKLAGFVPLSAGDAVALEQGGQFLHRLQFDASGMVRTKSDEKISGATALRHDPVLGLFLIDADRLVRLTAGPPRELKLVDTIDGRIGRPSGVKEATIHRVLSTDVDGDGGDELILCDDRRHQLTVLRHAGGEADTLESIASWQVFEDRKYPYGDDPSEVPIAEPRAVLAFDADGDPHRDLALLSQDRLVIYVGREAK